MPGTNFTWTRLSGGNRAIQNALEAIDDAWDSLTVEDDSITNAKIKSDAAIAYSKLAELTATYMLVGNGSDTAVAVDITGDIGVSNAGVVSITADSIINADVKTDAAIAFTKLAALADAKMLVGNVSNVAVAVDITGDIAVSNAGVVTVTDLTISGEAQGEVLYNNGSGWESLNVGTAGQALITAGAASNPYWGEPSVALASKLTGSFIMEGGTHDITHDVTTQTAGAPTLTIPDFANVDDTYTFLTLAQTFVGVKTFNQTSLALKGGDANACVLKINETLTGSKTLNIKINDTDRTVDLSGNITTANDLITVGNFSLTLTTTNTTDITLPTTGTLATLAGSEALTNKELTSPTITTMLIDDGDAGLTVTSADQTNGGAVATIPNISDAADSFVMNDTAATLKEKTLTDPKIVTTGAICDAGGDEYMVFTEDTTPVTYIGITSGDSSVAPQVRGAGETDTDLLIAGTGTGDVYIGDGADITKDMKFELVGATTGKTMTIISSQTDNRSLTLPDATDTLTGKATTDIYTNKSIDCKGTGNVITNVNADELDSVALGATAVFGIPFAIIATVSNLAAAGANLLQDSSVKYLIVGAELINSSVPDAAATWQLCQGTVGAIGTAITEAVAADNADKIKTVALSFDDTVSTIASGSGGDLCIVGDASGTLDGTVIVSCIRID